MLTTLSFLWSIGVMTTPATAQEALVNCSVRPFKVVEISTPITGVVDEVFVQPGQVVAAGDPILKLDDDLMLADLAVAEKRAAQTASIEAAIAQVELLKSRIERLRTAFKRKAITLNELEDAELELTLAQNTVERQTQELNVLIAEAERAALTVQKALVKSPLDGIIGEDLAAPGETLSSQIVATLTVTNPMRAEAFVPTDLLDDLLSGEAVFTVNGTKLEEGAAELDYVSPVANLSSNTISVFYKINDPNVLPGHVCLLGVAR